MAVFRSPMFMDSPDCIPQNVFDNGRSIFPACRLLALNKSDWLLVVPIKSLLPAMLPDIAQPVLPDKRFIQPDASLHQKDWVSVSYTNKPVAGDTIAERWVVVMRGTSMPLFVDWTSRIALTSGV